MNIINQFIFFKIPVNSRTLCASLIGITGLALVFYPEFAIIEANSKLTQAVVLGIIATWFASLGNIISVRNTHAGLPVMRTNMIGMFAGAVCISAIAIMNGDSPVIETTTQYLGSLIYLAVFGSVVAFGCYLTHSSIELAQTTAHMPVLRFRLWHC